MPSHQPNLPIALPGFENVHRFWDPKRGCFVAKVMPGEYFVTAAEEAIATILGSCVAACIRDPKANIGGLNHFMLPIDNQYREAHQLDHVATRYGNWAMEHLINDILKFGGKRENLEIKIFGGGAVLENITHNAIGDKNIAFVLDYLQTERLPLHAKDVGGKLPRKIIYFPQTGEVKVAKLASQREIDIQMQEQAYFNKIKSKGADGDVELFN